VEQSPSSVVVTDVKGNISFVNPHFCRVSGYTPDEVLGQNPRILKSDRHPQEFYSELWQTILAGHDWRGEIINRAKDGTYYWDLASIAPIRDKAGTITHFAKVSINITDRKQMEMVLAESEARYRLIINTAAEGFWLSNTNGEIIEANHALCKILGYTEAEMLGRPTVEFLDPENQEIFNIQAEKIRLGGPLSFGISILAKNGQNVPVIVHASLLKDYTGHITGTFAFVTDLSDIKRAEAQLRERDELLRNLSQHVPGILYQFRLFPDGHIQIPYVSQGVLNILGITPESVQEDADQGLGAIHPADIERVADSINQSASALAVWELEFRIKLPGKGLRWLRGHSTPERLEDGSTLWYGYISDVTDHKQAEVALRESEEKFSKVFNNSPNPMLLVDLETLAILEINNAYTEKTGYAADEVVNIPGLFGFVGIDPARTQSGIRTLRETGSLSNFEVTLEAKNGDELIAVVVGESVDIHDKKMAIISALDITQRKQMELQLRREVALNQAVADLSEEVLSPDLSLAGMAALIHKSTLALTASESGYVSVIHPDSGDHICHAISKMLLVEEPAEMPVTFSVSDEGPDNLWNYSLKTKTSFFTNDPAGHAAAKGTLVGHAPLYNFLSVPVKVDGQMLGQIGLVNSNRDYNEQDVTAVERIARVYAIGILRRRYEAERLAITEQALQAHQELAASEANFRQLAENIEHVLFLRDSDQIIYINQAYESVYGASLEELYRRPRSFLEMIVLEDRPRVLKAYEAEISQHCDFNEVFRIRHPSKGIRWLWTRTFHFVVTNSDTIRRVGITEDITDMKQAEKELQEALEQTQTLYTATLALSSTINLGEVLRRILDELKKVVPYDMASVQVLRDDYFEIIDGAGFDDLAEVLGIRFEIEKYKTARIIAETRRPLIINNVSESGWIPASSQDRQTRSWMGVPLLFGDRLIGKLGIDKHEPEFFTDKHADLATSFATQAAIAIENARIFEEMEQARLEAEAANHAKSQFLANVSHELRTPLTGILGYAQILNNDPSLSRNHQHAVDTIFRSGEHLLLLINDILDLSKLEAGQVVIYANDVSLPDFLRTLLDIIGVRARQKDLSLDYQPAQNIPRLINTDEKRLRQILLNLLSNAVKFTEKGGVTFRVEVASLSTSTPQNDNEVMVRFEVTDTGIGIATEDQEGIFDRFRQIGGFEGTGLGLAITMRLVQLMGGTISVTSTLGEGSTFVVELPVRTLVAPETTVVATVKGQNIVGVQHTGRPYTILVVDDREDNRAVVRALLEPRGFNIRQAASGQAALQAVIDQPPNLILMDLLMPGMDGYEATKRIRRIKTSGELPIIAVSASVSDEIVGNSRAAGCNDFLSKPILTDQLLQKLAHHLDLQPAEARSAMEYQPAPQSESAAEVVLPPPAALDQLYLAAQTGDIATVQEQLLQLEADYPAFSDPMLEMAHKFRLDLIEEQIKAIIDAASG
jgi:PAS domain S-box-containing protein